MVSGCSVGGDLAMSSSVFIRGLILSLERLSA
jgi:hypothetical protein